MGDIVVFMAFFLPPYSKIHIIIFGSLALLACFTLLFLFNNSLFQNNNKSSSVVETITSKEVTARFEDTFTKVQDEKTTSTWLQEDFVVFDIRDSEAFERQHIKGAISAPVAYLEYANLEQDVDMIIFSENKADLDKAVNILKNKNIRNVYVLHDNLVNLEKNGYKLTEKK